MLSVGVDVRRLGLMVVAGQPKTTAEYIQATSRVGRSHPGIVCTVMNWARPRDLSHYEQFEHYHRTFYQYVEALSVTPFASRAIDRGLSALLVACIRQAGLAYNANDRAAILNRDHPFVQQAIAAITRRAFETESAAARDRLQTELEARIDYWLARARKMTGGEKLGYRTKQDGLTIGLLRPTGQAGWEPFTCLNSLRDVEPMINLVLDDHGLDTVVADTMPAPQKDEADSGDEEDAAMPVFGDAAAFSIGAPKRAGAISNATVSVAEVFAALADLNGTENHDAAQEKE
jgi:hypothetical protein